MRSAVTLFGKLNTEFLLDHLRQNCPVDVVIAKDADSVKRGFLHVSGRFVNGDEILIRWTKVTKPKRQIIGYGKFACGCDLASQLTVKAMVDSDHLDYVSNMMDTMTYLNTSVAGPSAWKDALTYTKA